MNRFANCALVTGASSGIGWQLSACLAKRGYPIIAVSNQSAELETLKNQLESSHGITVHTLPLDLAMENAAGKIWDFCVENGLEVEVLVNCAGFLIRGEILHSDPERMRTMLYLHMTTPSLLCRYFAGPMIGRGKGYILNVSSIAAVMPFPTISLYGPTKAYLRNFTRALRAELKPRGIHVTCLIPGATDTNLLAQGLNGLTGWKKLGVVKDPKSVAFAGIKALFMNRAECIPGCINRFIVRTVPLLPHFVISLIYKPNGDYPRSQSLSM